MIDPHFRSAKQLASDIRRRKLGCLEVLDLYLARMERLNGKLNAIVVTDVDGARGRPTPRSAGASRGARSMECR